MALPRAGVLILGEVHDNPVHHEHQARVVASWRPGAVVLEMLTPEQAARIGDDRNDAAALAERIGWAQTGWPDWAMYHPIILAAGAAPVFGGAVEREAVRRATREGAAAVLGPDAARFGLDRPLAPGEQAAREAELAAAHCGALPADALAGMVEAQRLRDAGLAQAVLAALDSTGGPVIVITGNGHARRDHGVPRLLAEAAPGLRVLSVGQFEAAPAGEVPFDLWLVADPAPRGDPCAAFR